MRLGEVMRQREVLQHMEIGMEAHAIAQSENAELQSNYEAQQMILREEGSENLLSEGEVQMISMPNSPQTLQSVSLVNWGIFSPTLSGTQETQEYRHVEPPGWKLSWTWPGDEVIWNILGAEATRQGNCSNFTGNLPHCCERNPTIVDLPLGTPYNKQTINCCRGGALESLTQNPAKYMSTFNMVFGHGNLSYSSTGKNLPFNFSLGVPGYTCSRAYVVPPSTFHEGKQRITQALDTFCTTWFIIPWPTESATSIE